MSSSSSPSAGADVVVDLATTWNVDGSFGTDFESTWNIGDQVLYWFEVTGDCREVACPPTACPMSFIVNVLAPDVASVCTQLRNRQFIRKIRTIKRSSIPARRSDRSAPAPTDTTDVTCDVPVEAPFCNTPECLDFCVDFDVSTEFRLGMGLVGRPSSASAASSSVSSSASSTSSSHSSSSSSHSSSSSSQSSSSSHSSSSSSLSSSSSPSSSSASSSLSSSSSSSSALGGDCTQNCAGSERAEVFWLGFNGLRMIPGDNTQAWCDSSSLFPLFLDADVHGNCLYAYTVSVDPSSTAEACPLSSSSFEGTLAAQELVLDAQSASSSSSVDPNACEYFNAYPVAMGPFCGSGNSNTGAIIHGTARCGRDLVLRITPLYGCVLKDTGVFTLHICGGPP